MAGNLTKRDFDTGVCEFYVDTVDEIDYLPTAEKAATGNFKNNPNFNLMPPVGSICVVGNGGNMTIFILTGTGWAEI